ncbi:MAG: divalent-cation tolerance protein CutA [Bryobacteraceae bacterium]
MSDPLVVFSTCGSDEEARRIARHLVESRLAACVNIVPAVESVYWWQNHVETAGEWLLIIKTCADLFEPLAAELKSVHSYEIPEILALPVLKGLPSYIQWIHDNVSKVN